MGLGFGLRKGKGRDDYGTVQNASLKFSRDWMWPLVVAGVVVWASNHGRVATPEFTRWIPNFDKVAHFSIYGLLATLTVRAGRGRWAPWVALAAVSLFGVIDEWHQSFVPGRSCDAADWVADTLGAALAIALYTRWGWYRMRLEMPLGHKARVEIPPPVTTLSEE